MKTPFVGIGLASLLIAAIAYLGLDHFRQADNSALAEAGIVLLPEGRPLPQAKLSTAGQQPFGAPFFTGKWTLVLFGYTYCPDICPTTLATLRQIDEALPTTARARLRVTMISVDPHRDTPERLEQYVTYFNPEFTAMSGPLQDVQRASSAMGIPFVPGDTSQASYTVNHSGNLALIDPQGEIRGMVRSPLRTAALIQALPGLLANE